MEQNMRPGHARPVLTKPTPVIQLLPGPLGVFRGPPMLGADLRHCAGYGVPHLVEAGFLGWWWGDRGIGTQPGITDLFYLFNSQRIRAIIPKGYVAKAMLTKGKKASCRPSAGQLQQMGSVTLHGVLCARLGGRSTPIQ